MNHHARSYAAGPRRLDHERASQLLARYPNVSGEEAREIMTFMQFGRYLDVSLLTNDQRLKPNLDAFLRDHRLQFELNSGQGTAIAGAIILLLFVLWAIWTAIS
jgi:hypothetical protein